MMPSHAAISVSCFSSGGSRSGCGSSLFGRLFLGELFAFFVVDELQELVGALGLEQLVAPIDVHEHGHEACEHFEVHFTVARCCDHEDQLAGLSVGSFVVDALRHGNGGQCRLGHGVGLGVRNCHPLTNGSRSASLAGQDGLAVDFNVVQVAGTVVEADELFDSFGLRSDRYAKLNGFRCQKVGNSHGIPFPELPRTASSAAAAQFL